MKTQCDDSSEKIEIRSTAKNIKYNPIPKDLRLEAKYLYLVIEREAHVGILWLMKNYYFLFALRVAIG